MRGRPSADGRFDDLSWFARRLALRQCVDMLHAALDLAPDGVLAVEEAGVVEANEKLAVGAVGVLRASHRGRPAYVRLSREFRLQVGEIGTVVAGPSRIAALRHEARDHTMERHIIVKAAVGELGDALDVTWCEVGAELDDDIAAGGKSEGEAVGVGHAGGLQMKASKGARFRRGRVVAPERPRP